MKTLLLIFISVNIFFFSSKAQSFKVIEGDTVNYVDANKNKQGLWKDAVKRTEGYFINDEKEGLWKSFYKSGTIKSKITYIHGEKRGYSKIYYEGGQIAEEGMWVGDKWTGKYKSYYNNGKLSYLWNYNESGNRSGYQKYFYENGNIKIEGEWLEGKEEGLIKEYYSSGVLKSKKTFCNGKCKTNLITVFPEKDSVQDIIVMKGETVKKLETDVVYVEAVKSEKNTQIKQIHIKKTDSIKVFKGNGEHILYNKLKKTEREGKFINGILQNGKRYFYDKKGALRKTEIYKLGKRIEVIIN